MIFPDYDLTCLHIDFASVSNLVSDLNLCFKKIQHDHESNLLKTLDSDSVLTINIGFGQQLLTKIKSPNKCRILL